MEAGGGEVHVARHVVAGLDGGLRQQVLGTASLMGGHDVLVAVVLADGVFEVGEVDRTGVGLVAEHHARPLAVAHRVRARVGQQVDVHVGGVEQDLRMAASRSSRVVVRRGSTTLILYGSATYVFCMLNSRVKAAD